MNIELIREKESGCCLLRIEGEMTIYGAAEMKEKLISSLGPCSEINADLSQVSEIDTSGIQLLLLLRREAQAQGKRFRIISKSAAVETVTGLLNLNEISEN